MGAPEAVSWGLIDRLIPAAMLESAAFALCGRALRPFTRILACNQFIVNGVTALSDRPTLHAMFEAGFSSADFRESVRAFRGRRKPVFE